MNKNLIFSIFLFAMANINIACNKDDQECNPGELGCWCYSNSTCNDPYWCSGKGVCFDPDAPTDTAANDSTTTLPVDTGEDVFSGPHALGQVTLSETHVAGGNPTPMAFALFMPNTENSSTTTGCADVIGSCRIFKSPSCTGCQEGEYCAFNDQCQSVCNKVCDLACATGEECYFPYAGATACRRIETFDAGSLSFVGSPTNLTMFPPYSFSDEAGAAPYLPGTNMQVIGSGSAAAGFAAFDKAFTSTTFVQTYPSLKDLSLENVFGTNDVTIGWTPGVDQIKISGIAVADDLKSGMFECSATDSSGQFILPRQVISQSIGAKNLSTITLSVVRKNQTVHKDLSTVGALTNTIVESEAWLEIITTSTESHTFIGCSIGETSCGSTCTNITGDVNNCGACGKTCEIGESCSSGVCGPDCGAETYCDPSCVNTYNDDDNCGGCGVVCGGGTTCEAGNCQCHDYDRPDYCANMCVDTYQNAHHCGECDVVCPAELPYCSASTCVDDMF